MQFQLTFIFNWNGWYQFMIGNLQDLCKTKQKTQQKQNVDQDKNNAR